MKGSENLLRHQQHFTDILAILNEVMCLRSLVEAEAPRDLRLDHALATQSQYLLGPFAHAIDLAPHVSKVDAEDALVRVHQRDRIELKPRRTRQHGEHAKHAAVLPICRGGNAEHAEPPCRGENAISLLPGIAADGIKDELDAAAIGNLAGTRFEILRPIVD